MNHKFFSSLLLTILIPSTSLLVQAQDTSAPIHYHGYWDNYLIGSSENPVTATEYCEFLKYQVALIYQITGGRPEAGTEWKYYDSSFMSSDQDWFSPSHPCCINRSRWRLKGYDFSVVSGHENDIIDAVWRLSIQKEFNEWRKQQDEKQQEAE